LAHPHFNNLNGVYIIWHSGPNASTVYVGKGLIRQRLLADRVNSSIQQFNDLGLFVTWASVDSQNVDGVENYLIERLNPKISQKNTYANQILVNLPW
jgi:hypothetical protein